MAPPNICSPVRCLLGDFEEKDLASSKKDPTENSVLQCQKSFGTQMEETYPTNYSILGGLNQ